MADFNQAILVGRLTRDPELRYTPDGVAVCNFGLASNRKWTAKDGQKKEDAVFLDIVVWARLAEISAEYLKKGREVMIVGRIAQEKWENARTGKSGSKTRIVAEQVQFLGPNPDRSEPPPQEPS
jgi:single-strand DNA-binding protein